MDQFADYLLPSSLLGLLLIIPIFFFVFLKPKLLRQLALHLPPGPSQLPLIGSLHHLLNGPTHRVLRDLSRRHGPLMFLNLGHLPVLVASTPDAAMEIMRTHDINFASRLLNPSIRAFTAGGSDIVFAPYGDHWRELRKICVMEVLSAKRVESFKAVREDEVSSLVRSIAATASSPSPLVHIRRLLAGLMVEIMSRVLIGEQCGDRDLLLREMDKAIDMAAGFSLPDLYPSSSFLVALTGAARKGKRCRDAIFRTFDVIIEQHQERRRAAEGAVMDRDVLDILLRVLEESKLAVPLSMDIVKAVIFDLYAGATEIAATTVEWAMIELIKKPAVMELAQQEVRKVFDGRLADDKLMIISEEEALQLKYLQLVVRETLRLHVPAPLLLPRQCRASCQIMGYDIPEGTAVFVNAWAIARDPHYWGDAEEFKPERFEESTVDYKGANFEYIPFGAGRRMCPGITLGVAEITLSLANLLFHFNWKLPEGMKPDDIDVSDEVFGTTARLRSELQLQPILHS